MIEFQFSHFNFQLQDKFILIIINFQFSFAGEVHNEASVPRAALPPLLFHCPSRSQGETNISVLQCVFLACFKVSNLLMTVIRKIPYESENFLEI